MSKTVSTRLNDNDLELLEEIAKKECLDRASLIRKFILKEIKNYKIREMGELYRKGLVSLQEAAYQAKVSIYEMMDYLVRENISPPEQSRDEILQEIRESEKYNKSI